MKKIAVSLSLILCSIAFLSCDDDPEPTSLAGSVWATMYGDDFQAEGSYDGAALVDYDSNFGYFGFHRVTDKEVSFSCHSKWDETTFEIAIPRVPLFGKPGDVTLDYISTDAYIIYNKVKFAPTAITVKGWIKDLSLVDRAVNLKVTAQKPTPYNCACNIEFNCTLEGKPLNLKVTSVK